MPGTRLVLMRHAKSAYPDGVIDHDRPLSERGLRDANASRLWLAGKGRQILGPKPKILVSTAMRTQQTWLCIQPAFDDADSESSAAIYEAAVSSLVDLCAPLIESGRSTLLIGHNPGVELLADFLSDPARSTSSWTRREKYPTSAIAALSFIDDSWARDSAWVEDFVVPRG